MVRITEDGPTVPFIPGIEPPRNWTPGLGGNRWDEKSPSRAPVVENSDSGKTDEPNESNQPQR